ncbi:MAG: hypothetical protein ACOY3Z_03275 [Thermodesulfobacteriota bacterium]
MKTAINAARCLVAGATGGLVNSLTLWLLGDLGITPALGFNLAPELTMPWLMQRLVPSAIWGLLFLLPFWKDALLRKGLVLSLPLWLVMMLVVFPMKMQAGMFGLALGAGAPVWGFLFTSLWGVTASQFLAIVWREQ